VGEVPALLPPGTNNAFSYRMDAIPSVGEHTQRILKDMGLSDDTISLMKTQGAI
jgi:itaconate CoA-transferase